jgi:ATP-dependent DNA helicase HFM1/MER3
MTDNLDSAYSGEEEFPSPSMLRPNAFVQKPSPEPYVSFRFEEENAAPSSFPDNSLQNLEVDILELADTAMISAPSPKVDSSFANGIFDFDAFNDWIETPKESEIPPFKKDILKNEASSTPVKKDSLKRDRSVTPELPEVKHRRVTKDEHVSQVIQAAVPDWVNDFDSELIDELKGYVDFVD